MGVAVQDRRVGVQVQGGPTMVIHRLSISANAAIFFNGRLPLDTFLANAARRDCDRSLSPDADSLAPCSYGASATPALHLEFRGEPGRTVAWQLGMGYRIGRGPDEPYAMIMRTFRRARLAGLSLALRAGRTHTSIVVGQRL